MIAFGLAALIVSVRYRSLVPLMLGLAIVERTLHALNAWVIKRAGAGHHPPEHYAVLAGLPLLFGAFILSLRDCAGAFPANARPDNMTRERETGSGLRP